MKGFIVRQFFKLETRFVWRIKYPPVCHRERERDTFLPPKNHKDLDSGGIVITLRSSGWSEFTDFSDVCPARFSQEPADQSVVLGQRVVLSCVVFNYSGIVQWTKDGLALGIGEDLRDAIIRFSTDVTAECIQGPTQRGATIVWLVDVGQYNLEISSAELSDDSLYECQATEAALRSRRAKLTVLIPPDEPVIEGSPEILLTAGIPYNISCVSRGAKPASVIEWQKDGFPIEGAFSVTELLLDRKRVTTRSYMPILPLDTDTGKNFTCVATNQAVPMGKRASITLNVHHPPVVTLSIEPRSVLEGERVTFTCQASANPPLMGYKWAKGGVVIQGARESVFVTKADHSFFTEPVSCQVFNAVGSTNVLSNNNQLYLKSVSQADAGQYVCKAIVPRIGVGEVEVALTVNGPPIISSESVQYAARGERGEVKCYIASTPAPDKIVWAWKENVWEKEKGTLSERYTVEQSKLSSQGGAVISTLTINNVMESDFQSTYNCTAWNSFGPGTMIITLEETGRRGVTLGKPDIKVETINKESHSLEEDSASVSTATRMVKAMYSFLPSVTLSPSSQPFKDDIDLKQELRSDTLDTRQDYELKDPTNGYYNVRASTHDEGRPASRSMHYSDYRTSGQPGGAAAVVSGSSVTPVATAGPGTPSSLAPGSRAGCYDPRPPSRLSHNSYAQFNTFSRAGQSQQPAPGVAPQISDFPTDCSLLDSPGQLGYDNYGYPSHYPSFRMGFAPPSLAPLESGSAYEMYGVGPSVSSSGGAGTPESGLGKYGSSTRFSYTSQHSDYSHRHTQRMQTHV
ncbi:hypothetical protein DNTS_029911 [Danionella cerebrum]|uniref:Ig-like domain-containing protein n=1 Tax=Danionella cerebrum TaxID=2873325 RepID=A0A553QYE7_9TELE|nr:hypothetical protein DNTS_029911 [Danionella translucida]